MLADWTISWQFGETKLPLTLTILPNLLFYVWSSWASLNNDDESQVSILVLQDTWGTKKIVAQLGENTFQVFTETQHGNKKSVWRVGFKTSYPDFVCKWHEFAHVVQCHGTAYLKWTPHQDVIKNLDYKFQSLILKIDHFYD